jgi:hypothetical protein
MLLSVRSGWGQDDLCTDIAGIDFDIMSVQINIAVRPSWH